MSKRTYPSRASVKALLVRYITATGDTSAKFVDVRYGRMFLSSERSHAFARWGALERSIMALMLTAYCDGIEDARGDGIKKQPWINPDPKAIDDAIREIRTATALTEKLCPPE